MKHTITTLFLLLLLAVAGTAKAQTHEFASIGAQWYYEFTSNIAGPMYYVGYEQYGIVGDTIIKGQNCMVMQIVGGESTPCENMGKTSHYLYKSADKLYWYNEDTDDFSVLHDYSAQPSDSWTITMNTCELEILVDSTDTQVISGEEKRVLYVHDNQHYYDGCIIEDVGHTTMFFPMDLYWECEGQSCDGIVLTKLRCFIDETLTYHPVDIPCDTSYYGLNNTIDEMADGFTIYPTMAEDKIVLNAEIFGSEVFYYEIIDILGRRCKSDNLYRKETTVSLVDLPSGLFLLNIFDTHRVLFSKKFFKK